MGTYREEERRIRRMGTSGSLWGYFGKRMEFWELMGTYGKRMEDL